MIFVTYIALLYDVIFRKKGGIRMNSRPFESGDQSKFNFSYLLICVTVKDCVSMATICNTCRKDFMLFLN
jgi:hypothetical protein